MFSEPAKKQLLDLNRELSQDVTIGLADSGHLHSQVFHEFCDELARLVPKIRIVQEDGSPQKPPQIFIGSGLRYQALPTGLEMRPFIEALTALDSGPMQITDSIKSRLQKNSLPATLTVFISPQCTYCPKVISQLIPLSMAEAGVQLIVIDGTLFPEAAQAHQIQSVPTILLDKQFRWTGSVALEEIIDAISTRNPAMLGATSLESILKDGQASHLAAMMLEAQQIFPAFYDLLIHDKWPIRLGAMVVMEEIAAQTPGIASEAIEPLWSRYEAVSDQIKGDILYLFGEIGDHKVIPRLEEVIAGEFDAEVKEAAREAMEKLMASRAR
ncbi:MAG: thioredoxin family protein, partial [Desulfobacterales bacterium]